MLTGHKQCCSTLCCTVSTSSLLSLVGELLKLIAAPTSIQHNTCCSHPVAPQLGGMQGRLQTTKATATHINTSGSKFGCFPQVQTRRLGSSPGCMQCLKPLLRMFGACSPEALPFVAEGRTWSPGMISVTRPVYASTTVTAVNLDSSRAQDSNPQPCYPDICFAVDNFDNTFEDLVSHTAAGFMPRAWVTFSTTASESPLDCL